MVDDSRPSAEPVICIIERWVDDGRGGRERGQIICRRSAAGIVIEYPNGSAEQFEDELPIVLEQSGLFRIGGEEWPDFVLSDDSGMDEALVLDLVRRNSPDFQPTGEAQDLLALTVIEPLFTLNGRAFSALSFDDGSYEFIDGGDDEHDAYRVLAEVTECEEMSRTSGAWIHQVGRLPSGEIFLLEDLDECEGLALGLRGTYSDVDAVVEFVTHVKREGNMIVDGSALICAVYGEGRDIATADQLDARFSDSLELAVRVSLPEDEIAELVERLS